MVKMKKRNKILLILVFIFIFSFSFTSNAIPNKDQLKVSVKAGYEDIARLGSEVPFKVTLENQGESFSGELHVLVGLGNQRKVIYAMPFEISKTSTKELIIDIPVNTADKKYEVRITAGSKTIESFEYQFKKVISPSDPTIGILSNVSNKIGGIKGLKLPEIMDKDYYMKTGGYVESSTGVERAVETIYLDKDTMPDRIEELAGFDYILAADFDTSTLSKKQLQTLEDWIQSGKTLILAGGTNGKKVYSSLDEKLMPFKIIQSKKASITQQMEEYTEKKLPDVPMDLDIIDTTTESKILIGDKTMPLAAHYTSGSGRIIFLAFDPTVSPVAEWNNSKDMWRKLFMLSSVANIVANPGYPGHFYYGDLPSNVPEDQSPNYNMLFLLIGFYILIVGPLLYILLKIKDKRDYNWVVIPAIAFLFMGIIYVAGFKTRYTTAVLNNVSMIKLDTKTNVASISTSAGAFNNKKGNMKLEYNDGYGIKVSLDRDQYYDMNVNNQQKNYNIMGKVIKGQPNIYDLYNVSLWSPIFISSEQTREMNGDFIKDVNITKDSLSATITNTTEYVMTDSFVVMGNNYIDVGNLMPKESKKVEFKFGVGFKNSFEALMEKRYPDPYRNNNTRPKNWRENQRRRSAFSYSYSTFSGEQPANFEGLKMSFIALNFDNIDYEMKINGKKPKSYNTNIFYSQEEIAFEKGKRVEIPGGVIPVNLDKQRGGVGFDPFSEGFEVYEDGEIVMKFNLPKGIKSPQYDIIWQDLSTTYINNRYGNTQTTSNSKVERYIFNNKTSEWDEMDKKLSVTESSTDNKYINEHTNEILVKCVVAVDKSMGRPEVLGKPELSISGVIE